MIMVKDWIIKHPNIIASPITDDTLLVKDEVTGKILFISIFIPFILLTWILLLFYWIAKKTKMIGKYLLQTSVRDLHNNFIKSELDGGLECVWKG